MLYNINTMITNSVEQTIALGKKLGKMLPKGSTVILKGELACGKTTLTKGIGEALNVKQIINSPTFTILKIYEGTMPLYHIDAYRLENNNYDLGISEFEDDGISVIEWPEYYENYLPSEYLEIDFVYINDSSRDISFIGHGNKYEMIAKEMSC